MTAIQFGTGFMALDVINTPNPSSALMYVTAIVSMALAVTITLIALKLVPARQAAVKKDAPRRVGTV
jgi:hypothetical protein